MADDGTDDLVDRRAGLLITNFQFHHRWYRSRGYSCAFVHDRCARRGGCLPADATLVRRRLTTLSLMLCGAPAYLAEHPAPQSPADLADHNCLRYPYAPLADGWHFLDASGNPLVARISGSLISSSPDTMRAAAVAGIGLVITAPFLIGDLLASGALVPLLPGYRTQEVEINALYPHRRHLSAKVRVFIDMLVDRFAEEQHWLQPDRG